MAIHFDWYENPTSANQPKKKRYHARIVNNRSIDTSEVRSMIQARCTVTETDVTAVLDALSHVLGENLADGKQIHLDGIGYFHPTLTCTEEIAADTPRRNTKVRLKGIQFRSDQVLKRAIGPVTFKRIKQNKHSDRVSEVEIDIRLKEYFSKHQMLQRRDFERLCSMLRSTAMTHIRRLCKEGKLNNIGLHNQPIYVPIPGYYGISKTKSL